MKPNRHTTRPRPLDPDTLGRLALHYVGRYATTQAKLAEYLRRKVRERGWVDENGADIDAIVTRFVTLGYIDDQAFAAMRAASLGRRGFGPRRIEAALQASGIARDVRDALMPDAVAAEACAEEFARRKRFGPFATTIDDPAKQKRQFAAMIRAGHSFDLARRFTQVETSDVPIHDD